MTNYTSHTQAGSILTINGGSSSLKFALFGTDPSLRELLRGKIERIGLSGARLTYSDASRANQQEQPVDAPDHASAAQYLNQWLEERIGPAVIRAIGHRVVHGMYYHKPQRITSELIRELRGIIPFDPDHLPVEIELMERFHHQHPQKIQIVCFDTAFHNSMPRRATLLPIPRCYDANGIRRYGFHGLSYAYLMEALTREAGEHEAAGRIILAHLGNGASMAAVKNHQSMDTTMGFTPASGMPMGTRPGDLDPGLVWYWMHSVHLTATQINDMIHHRSGLLGVSESSSDLRDLLNRSGEDIRAAEAVEMFCYHARKWIGAMAAALGGLDTLVFSGGIGEHAGRIRSQICDELTFLGIHLDESCNREDAPVISAANSPVTVRVIPTDEERMIAKETWAMLQHADPSQPVVQPFGTDSFERYNQPVKGF